MVKIIVLSCAPVDDYPALTVPIREWLRDNRYALSRLNNFSLIEAAVRQDKNWENELQCEPHVAYDATYDSLYFIYKLVNNGTTFFVSHPHEPPMPKDEIFSVDVFEVHGRWDMTHEIN